MTRARAGLVKRFNAKQVVVTDYNGTLEYHLPKLLSPP